MLDRNADNKISKKDILEFVTRRSKGRMEDEKLIDLYPYNVSLNVEYFKFKRGD